MKCIKHPNWDADKCVWCHPEKKERAFFTTKDKLYHFIDRRTFDKPIEIRGKDHWKKELKNYNKKLKDKGYPYGELTDDKVKPRKPKFDRDGMKKTIGEARREGCRIRLQDQG